MLIVVKIGIKDKFECLSANSELVLHRSRYYIEDALLKHPLNLFVDCFEPQDVVRDLEKSKAE
jgi:hypothetical protein